MKSLAVLSLMMAVLLGLAAGLCWGVESGTLKASVTTEGLPFPCIAGAVCKVTLEYANTGGADVDLKNWSASCIVDGKKVAATLDPGAPLVAQGGKSVTATMTITLPESAGGKDILLACGVSAGGKVAKTDFPVPVTPELEITLLPQRLILDPNGSAKILGMSIINHKDKPFAGKVTITANKGLSVTPSQIAANIDSLGLEPYMLKVAPVGKPAPGHYTLWVDVDHRSKDWAMIDVPAVAKKQTVKVDGKLDDWGGAQKASIVGYFASTPLVIGNARFAYDAKNLYVAVEVFGLKSVTSADSVVIGIDPLINGANSAKGGYRSDDREYTLAGNGSVLLRTANGDKLSAKHIELPVALGKKNAYEVAIPWSQMKPFKPGAGKMIAMSVLFNEGGSKNVTKYEFGGGLAGAIDPRLFVPVFLGK